MKISLVRSGGFSGIAMPAKTMQTDDPAIKTLVEEVILSVKEDQDLKGRDMMHYSFFVEDGDLSSSFEFKNRMLPKKASELVAIILKS